MTTSSGYIEDSEIRMVAVCVGGREGRKEEKGEESARGADVDGAIRQPEGVDGAVQPEGDGDVCDTCAGSEGRWSRRGGGRRKGRRGKGNVEIESKAIPSCAPKARYKTVLIADTLRRRNDGRLEVVVLGIQFDPVPRIERRFLVRRVSGEGLRWSRGVDVWKGRGRGEETGSG
jgi:hypothetical protein